jgi:hypothetical protein
VPVVSVSGDMGWSPRNLKYMRAFAKAWPDPEIVQGRLAQLSWWHQVALLEKLDDAETRLWYAAKAAEHGWTRDVLVHQIEGALHLREGKGLTNFDRTLPAPQSELAQQVSRNPYIFGFLGLDEQASEREIERGLMANVERFLLEYRTRPLPGRLRHQGPPTAVKTFTRNNNLSVKARRIRQASTRR